MSTLRSVYHIARADYLQRTRSRQFLAVLAFVVSLGYVVSVGGLELVYTRDLGAFDYEFYYGRSNAAWVGTEAALVGTFFVAFGGFYVLKNTLARERRTGMDELLPSMAVSDRLYLLGKWLSNVAVVCTILVVLAAATVVLHAVNGVGQTQIVPLTLPIFLLAVPLGCLVAGVALLFETIDPLSGSAGNAVYFLGTVVVASWAYSAPVAGGVVPPVVAYTEPFGYTAVYAATHDTLTGVVPAYAGGPPVFGQVSGGEEFTFTWTGGGWPGWVYLKWALFAVGGATVAAAGTVTFDRFTAGERGSVLRSLLPVGDSADTETDESSDATVPGGGEPAGDTDVTTLVESLTPVRSRNGGGLGRLLVAEARIALLGRRRVWYLGAVSLFLFGVLADGLRGLVAPVAILWPVFLLSETGVRTRRHQTRELVVSSSHPVGQLAAEWAVGAGVLASLLAPARLPAAAGGDTLALLGFVATVAFVPSFALALGSYTGSTRAFEASYLALWYVGPVNGATAVDFAASTDGVTPATLLGFTAVGVALLGAALLGRSRFLR
ncbi:ABC transporter permease [Halobaculum sp. MBLA0143]|uniref:ABC transporter permease n=1 Tax=Halobaculum sp. MBLA0143 TaxID=3079933 RepID=UPI0035234FDF